ncbi:methyltransferase domain-containing protein [Ancylobacter sp. 6x-1]|uniref:Methyltransferase domain-containing protein n=1 Tax=Ancylobacter crimeensis TaxID=2579147 RepID=A0ABT0D7W7_9HYPH|nr:methyltransferase domain-containing protein [Ancylobacter crimeensis]MCK0196051.1 methyltransferase domain-containing protein [Ancylobacter crimeensis]
MSAAAVPLFLTSGDAAVDRRLDWARALLNEGNAADAAALLAEAGERAPEFLPLWFLLGEARAATGDVAGATEAFRRALALDPEDRLGAGAQLARLAPAQKGGAGLSAGYVRTLFDQYATRFDAALARLDYRGPELIAAALEQACARLGREVVFAHGVDLGCGTGLVGVRLAPQVGRLSGVDLSPNMIALAKERGLYDELAVGDMVAFLVGRPAGDADLVFAGDAFCYLDDLAPVLAESRRVLEPGGLLAFTVETHAGPGVLLRDTLRYAHAQAYVRSVLADEGFELLLCEAASTRTEKGEPVPGLVLAARRGA